MVTIYTPLKTLIKRCYEGKEITMKTKMAFAGIVASLVLFIGIVVSGVYVLDKFTNDRSETPVVALNNETNQNDGELPPGELSDIQKEIIDEVFEQLEDQLYDVIVKLDNSKVYISIED